jgi:hypothetical protein
MLAELGVTSVNDGIIAMARLITDHRKLEFVLAGESPEMKQAVYEAVRPHLSFEARPLDTYIAKAGERAEREQLPSLNEKGEIVPFRSARDQRTIDYANELLAAQVAKRRLTLTCGECGIQHHFYAMEGETPSATVRRARMSGWVYDYKADPVRELCPECSENAR